VWVGRPGVGWTPVATVAAGPDRLQLRWQWRASAQFTGEGLREPALTPRRRRVRIRLLPRTGGRPSRDPRHGSRTLRPARRPAGPPVHPPASAGRRVRRPRHARPSCASVDPATRVRRCALPSAPLRTFVGPAARVRRARPSAPPRASVVVRFRRPRCVRSLAPPRASVVRVRRPRHARPSLCASVGPVACVRRPRHARPSLCASVGPVVRVRRSRHAGLSSQPVGLSSPTRCGRSRRAAGGADGAGRRRPPAPHAWAFCLWRLVQFSKYVQTRD
jgi:hypothetical protein